MPGAVAFAVTFVATECDAEMADRTFTVGQMKTASPAARLPDGNHGLRLGSAGRRG